MLDTMQRPVLIKRALFSDPEERAFICNKLTAALRAINQPNVAHDWDITPTTSALECGRFRIVEQTRGRDRRFVRWQLLAYNKGMKATSVTPENYRHLAYADTVDEALIAIVAQIARDSITTVISIANNMRDVEETDEVTT